MLGGRGWGADSCIALDWTLEGNMRPLCPMVPWGLGAADRLTCWVRTQPQGGGGQHLPSLSDPCIPSASLSREATAGTGQLWAHWVQGSVGGSRGDVGPGGTISCCHSLGVPLQHRACDRGSAHFSQGGVGQISSKRCHWPCPGLQPHHSPAIGQGPSGTGSV